LILSLMGDSVPFNMSAASRNDVEIIFARYGVKVGGLTHEEFNSMMEEVTGEGLVEMWKDLTPDWDKKEMHGGIKTQTLGD